MNETQYLITNGQIALRIRAENPEMAFKLCESTMQIEGAWAHEVTYQEGVEHVSPKLFQWKDGGAIPILYDHKAAYFDENWIDRVPSTAPYTPAPLDMHKVVMLMGYGMSRPMSVHWRREYSEAKGYKTEVWTLNNDRVPGATRHFQIHKQEVCPVLDKTQFALDDLKAKGVYIYTWDNFPFDKMRRDYYCSTADYMMAIADAEGFGIVCTPGLDFAGMRRALEVHSMRYWIGVIEGKGGIVHRSPMSMMFRHLRYGFHTETEHYKFEIEPDARPPRSQS